MDRFVSQPIEFPRLGEGDELSRADLAFYKVDHSGPSYEGLVFVNNPGASLDTPRELDAGYAGSFTVFGHGGCYGEEGHCDVESRTTDEFDRRAPHPLTPYTKTVEVTEAVRGILDETITVTVVAVETDEEGPGATDAMTFELVRLLTYMTEL